MTESFASRHPAARPDTIIVAILTDGEENASRALSLAHIRPGGGSSSITPGTRTTAATSRSPPMIRSDRPSG